MAEVNVQSVGGDDWRRTGHAILSVVLLHSFWLRLEDFVIPIDVSISGVYANRAQRNLTGAKFDCTRKVQLSSQQHRRRPAAAWDCLLPNDMFLRAPFHRHVLRR